MENICLKNSPVLYHAPQIPAGMGPESTGMRLESARIHWNGTGIHMNDCIPAGIESNT